MIREKRGRQSSVQASAAPSRRHLRVAPANWPDAPSSSLSAGVGASATSSRAGVEMQLCCSYPAPLPPFVAHHKRGSSSPQQAHSRFYSLLFLVVHVTRSSPLTLIILLLTCSPVVLSAWFCLLLPPLLRPAPTSHFPQLLGAWPSSRPEMTPQPSLKQLLALPLALLTSVVQAANRDHSKDPGLFRFVSRPDIKAPKWKVHVKEESLVTPGHWFVAPFEELGDQGTGHGWTGPHIYDGDGQLVWSGADVVDDWPTIDFKLSNVRGEDMLTFLVHRQGDAYIMDNTLSINEKVDLGALGDGFNSHEFNFIENGTRAIIIHEERRDATKDQAMAIEWEKNCRTLFNGFKELHTDTWKPAHEWSSFGHVGLDESTFTDGGAEEYCNQQWGWDYIHFNSVDKDQNGDYYASARHTDTIYKISKQDGHIMWRLHGRQGEAEVGDFDMGDVSFSRQHNIRFHGFNGSHEIVSLLDNANGQDEQEPSNSMSRGLVLALQTDTEPRTARIVSAINHPDGTGSYAPRRGNYQVLPEGNVFIGWSEQAIHSEHTSDGTLVMEATLVPEWLGTYRSYKFPFVGRPAEPPRAASAAQSSHALNGTTTLVHVSWNGATEVRSWNLYKTTESGEPKIQIFSKEKTGFETAMVWPGYASHVIVEAVDAQGEVLGATEVVATSAPPSDAIDGAVADEVYWLQEVHGENDPWKYSDPYWLRHRATGNSIIGFLFGIVCTAGLLAGLWQLKKRGYIAGLRRGSSSSPSVNRQPYHPLHDQEQGIVESEERFKQSSPRSPDGFFRDRDSRER